MKNSDAADTLGSGIIDVLLREPAMTFLDCEGEVFSRGEFFESVARRAVQLRALGLGRDARIIVVSRRGGAFWVDLVAIWTLGGVVVPCDPTASSSWILALGQKARAQAVIGGEGIGGGVFDGLRQIDDSPRDTEINSFSITDIPSESTAALLFTSGSTGEPKGVQLSHRSLLGNSRAILKELPFSLEDRLFVSIPFHFTSAICHFLAAALTGATLITSERKLLPGDLKTALQESAATCFGGSPLQLRWIGEIAMQDTISLRWLMSSGDHLRGRDISLLRRHMPHTDIFTVYGLTEVGGRFCVLPANLTDQFAGSVGRPINGMAVSVLDDHGQPVNHGEIGHIFASGDYLFDRYFEDDVSTAQVLGPKGLATGDMGFLNEEGILYLAGRADEVFKVAGEKCSALEISDALARLGIFDDVVVLPIDDPFVEQIPKAYYVLKEGKTFDKGLALRHLRSVLTSAKIPREFEAVPSIPRTGSGKVNRPEFMAMTATILLGNK